MNYTKQTFDSPGYLLFRLTEEELLPIRQYICDRIEESGLSVIDHKMNPNDFIEMEDFDNSELVREKFLSYTTPNFNNSELNKSKKEPLRKYLESILLPLVTSYNVEFKGLKGFNTQVSTEPLPYCLHDFFINFTKKEKYFPIHDHQGIFNFVLWVQSPVNFDEENSYLPWHNNHGKFSFYYTNSLGRIEEHSIPVDKTYEGYGAFFPSTLPHIIHPFFKTDKRRIAVVGEFRLKV